jgi:DNA-binding HxlR family transcriptional regulator
MGDTGQALRETSDALLRDLDVLSTIEEEKRALEPGDPRLVQLAARIEEIAQRVLVGSVRQRQLTEVVIAQVEAASPDAPDVPIEEMPRSIQAILAEWREAERRVAAAAPGSAEATEAEALVGRLRDEYRRAHEAARDH